MAGFSGTSGQASGKIEVTIEPGWESLILKQSAELHNPARSLALHYEVQFVEVFQTESGPVEYRFTISYGSHTGRASVILTKSGVEIIEKGGKDPQAAATIALMRLLKDGRDPFGHNIRVSIPYGHAQHFAQYGNYNSLPVLTD